MTSWLMNQSTPFDLLETLYVKRNIFERVLRIFPEGGWWAIVLHCFSKKGRAEQQHSCHDVFISYGAAIKICSVHDADKTDTWAPVGLR